jgi:hypothetical protein
MDINSDIMSAVHDNNLFLVLAQSVVLVIIIISLTHHVPDICIFPLFIAKPHWLQTMIDGALSIEENLFWECKANGKPKPSYSWLRNGDNLMAEVCMEFCMLNHISIST